MTVEFWTWWLAAVVLAGLEIIMPGAALLWIGVAAALVGVVLLLSPELPMLTQLLIFALGALGAIFAVRLWARWGLREAPREHDGEDHPHLNRRAEHYIGTVHRLETPIINGRGRARVDDGTWAVEGPDLPKGADVRVIGVHGVVLKVEPAEEA